MRWNSASFWVIRSENAASRGAMTRCTAWNSGVLMFEPQMP
jgi:hypothetical protein